MKISALGIVSIVLLTHACDSASQGASAPPPPHLGLARQALFSGEESEPPADAGDSIAEGESIAGGAAPLPVADSSVEDPAGLLFGALDSEKVEEGDALLSEDCNDCDYWREYPPGCGYVTAYIGGSYAPIMAKNTALVSGPDSNGTTVAPLVVSANGNGMYIDDNEIDTDLYLHLQHNTQEGVKIRGRASNGSRASLFVIDGSHTLMIDGSDIDSSSVLSISRYSQKNTLINPNGGNVGIGTMSPANKLDVAGTIRAYELILETGWPDYVFDEGYDLMSLPEIERYIAENGRLPGIPSAAEVREHGLPVADSQALLLQKVEELTLHLIEQGKQIEQLRARVSECSHSSGL